MTNHVALFKLHLGNGQSIGPSALRSLWSRACLSIDVSVSRRTRQRFGYGDTDTYSMCGSPRLTNLPQIEARLRGLLDESRLIGTLTAIHD